MSGIAFSHGPERPVFAVKDSGERVVFDSGMVRDVQTGKVKYHLISSGPMLQRWAVHLTKGAEKYDDDNWRGRYRPVTTNRTYPEETRSAVRSQTACGSVSHRMLIWLTRRTPSKSPQSVRTHASPKMYIHGSSPFFSANSRPEVTSWRNSPNRPEDNRTRPLAPCASV